MTDPLTAEQVVGLRWEPTWHLRIEERSGSGLTRQVLQQKWKLCGGDENYEPRTEWRDIRVESRRMIEP